MLCSLTGLITEKKQKDRQTKAAMSASRQHLSSVRVVQRNLVYVIGLPLNIAEEDVSVQGLAMFLHCVSTFVIV
jgi:hypothetical protein